MRKNLLGASLMVAVLSATGSAHAQGFTDDGQFIFSIERFMPLFAYQSAKSGDGNGGTVSSHTSTTSLLTNGIGLFGTGGFDLANGGSAYNIPRLAFDYKFPMRLTVGGSVFGEFTLGSGQSTVNRNGIETDVPGPTYTLFGFAPRVGYILSISDLFAFWPRGGIEYVSLNVKSPNQGNPNISDSTTYSQWALDAEGMFVITPLPHVGITVGPVVDIPIGGSTSFTAAGSGVTTSTNLTLFHIGATAGLLIYVP
jgi:hypothetical protein